MRCGGASSATPAPTGRRPGGQLLRLADKIAYINHDIDDAMRAGILTNDDIPRPIARILGETHKDRINTLVTNMISHTLQSGELAMDPEVNGAMQDLRASCFSGCTETLWPRERNPRPKPSSGSCTNITSAIPSSAGHLPAPAHL